MSAKSAVIKLNNGLEMPMLGLGVYEASPEETVSATRAAISAGYRLIDTAKAYRNEAQVGEGLRMSGIDRSELFVTTKLFNCDYGYDSALRGFDESLQKLGLEYLDLYLLHWPTQNWQATLQSWKALERLLSEKRVRSIGVCNFLEGHLDMLLSETQIVPVINQIELHPYFNQKSLIRKNKDLGIVTEAWSPIGGVKNYGSWDQYGGAKDPLAEQAIIAIGQAHGKTPAQIILRWHIQNGVVAIPKSTNAERIAQNIDIFDFALTAQQMAQIDALEAGMRAGPHPKDVDTDSFAEHVR
ncbi:aldo/keto reductase [Pseudomonas sp. NPDC078700]|uniref:aldo/keto reductase n=1 Tax=Pseudomonas sp. NPDC078700 TaxID=3364424 RepID=UPI0037C7A07C